MLTPIQFGSLKSFQSKFFDVTVYSYEPIPALPDGVVNGSADDIIPRDRLFANRDRKGSFAGFSNLFRYALIERENVTWFDLDVICLNWPEEREDFLFGAEDDHGVINGAVLRLPGDSAICEFLLNTAATTPPRDVRWGMLGPKLVTDAVRRFDLMALAKPKRVFYHLSPMEIWRAMDPWSEESLREEMEGSWSIHLWNEVLRHVAPELAQALPPADSFVGRFLPVDGDSLSVERLPADWAKQVLRGRLTRYNSIMGRFRRRLRNVSSP